MKSLSQSIFFDNKIVSIIPDERTFELKISIQGEEDKPIYNVGDCISSLIIIFFTLFVMNYKFIFIEEPEINLHARMQRLIANLMTNYVGFKEKYIFITTHSNNIIDSDISSSNRKIFHTSKIVENHKTSINIEDLEENSLSILHDLGVQPSSLFITNKVIWIEGKYDALYIRVLLDKYMNEHKDKIYREGVDYVFDEMKNLVPWNNEIEDRFKMKEVSR